MILKRFLTALALVLSLCLITSGGAHAAPIIAFNISNVTATNLGPCQLIQVNEYIGCSTTVATDIENDATAGGLTGLSTTTGGGFLLTNFPFNGDKAPITNALVTATGNSNPNNFANFSNAGTGNSTSGNPGSGAVNVPTAGGPAFNTNNTFGYAFWLVTDNSQGEAVSATYIGDDTLDTLAIGQTSEDIFATNGEQIGSFDLTPVGLPEPSPSLTLGLLLGTAWLLRRSQLV